MSASFWLIASMAHMDRTAEFDLAERKSERHCRERDQHQHPERIHVAQERRLSLHLLPDPLDGLVMRLHQRTAAGSEVARDLLQRVLILRARRDHLLNEPALVELLAMCQHVGD